MRWTTRLGAVAAAATLVSGLGAAQPLPASAASATPFVSTGPDVIVGEGDGYVEVPITLSAPSTNTVSMYLADTNVTAGAGYDYTCPTSNCGALTLVFAPGETTKTIRMNLLDDTTAEPAESFQLSIYSPTNATINHPITQITIIDND